MIAVGEALYTLSQSPSNDSFTKGSVRTSKNNMDLDIDGLIYLRVNNRFNSIVGYLNINSLRNKIDDLHAVCKKVQINILCIDETKLDDSFPDRQSKINGYQFPFLRRDRENRGGGKIVFIKQGLIVNRLKLLELTIQIRNGFLFLRIDHQIMQTNNYSSRSLLSP